MSERVLAETRAYALETTVFSVHQSDIKVRDNNLQSACPRAGHKGRALSPSSGAGEAVMGGKGGWAAGRSVTG